MIISELVSSLDLVVKFTNFATQLQDGWYKGSAEVDAFRDKVWILSAKHAQFNNQLRRFGISEDDHLVRLLKAANESLEKEQQYVQKLQNSRFLRGKKKVFPAQLSYFLGKVVEIVDAGPQLLATRVANYDLLEKNLARAPALLPFGPDSNYVPIVGTITKVKNALENREGPRVVTVYGGPGMGKSSLVKFVALYYQDQKEQAINVSSSKPTVFVDGVHYLFCGQKAQDKVKQLQLELLQSLGFGTRYAALQNDGSTADAVQEGEYLALPSLKTKLVSCLAEQNLLIVLDDLWEEKVLQELLVPAKGVKYLVTSQIRDIWGSAEKIQLERPKLTEARQIMANYTDGLPIKREFPEDLKSVTDGIIRAVEHHPLSLANVGMSINRTWATDKRQWELIKENINVHLDENDFRHPLGYDTPYNLAVSASMMLMVESLPSISQRLLCLLALFKGASLPQYLVKYFFKFVQPIDFALKFTNQQKFLEDRSLIESRIERNRPVLETHGLRTYYIRKNKPVEVMSIASEILPSTTDQDAAKVIRRGDAEETLVTVLSAMHFDQSFKDIVARSLGNHLKILNGDVIPRSLDMRRETTDIVEGARRQQSSTRALVGLLNADYGEPDWKHRAHEYAKKVIIKFICQGKLDDHSMACLLQLSQTTSTACDALSRLIFVSHGRDYHEHHITFSSAHGETMNVLLDLLHSEEAPTEQRAAVIRALPSVLYYEGKSAILRVIVKCAKLLRVDSNPSVQLAVLEALSLRNYYNNPAAVGVILKAAQVSSLLENLIALLSSAKDDIMVYSALSSIRRFSMYRSSALQISALPGVLQMLVNRFVSGDAAHHLIAGSILSNLSLVKEIRLELGAVKDIWEGLVDILTKMEPLWRLKNQRLRTMEKRACLAATILGSLALEKDLRETRPSLSCVQDSLLFLQLVEMARSTQRLLGYNRFLSVAHYSSTRALAVLYSDPSKPRSGDFLSLGDSLNVIPSHEYPTSMPLLVSAAVYVSLYWTRVEVYTRMGSYSEALTYLNLAHHHLSQYMKLQRQDPFYHTSDFRRQLWLTYAPAAMVLRDCRIYLQAMLEDYGNALPGATDRLDDEGYRHGRVGALAELGVLKRLSGNLQGALVDLNASADLLAKTTGQHGLKSRVLKHRGYVKFLMNDKTGAKEDAKSAKKLRKLENDLGKRPDPPDRCLWLLRTLRVNYLGYSL